MVQKKGLLLVSIVFVLVIVVALLVSCGKSKESTNATTKYSTASQAAGSGSSAKAAVDLSKSMSAAAAGLGSSSNPSGYAPGMGGTATTTTEGLSSIDPRLKVLADNLLGQMQISTIKNAVAKARSLRTSQVSLASQVTSTGNCAGGVGSFLVTGSDTSTAGYNEYTVDIILTGCADTTASIYSTLTGTIHVYDKQLAGNASNTRNATIDLIAVDYNGSTVTKTKVAKGVFNSTDAGSLTTRTGADSADGRYSETVAATGGNQVGTFYFTNLTRSWTWDNASGVITNADALNGSFGLTIASPSGSLQLDIALAALNDTIRTNGDGSLDQWINGSITITWTPDLTLYGCIGGTMSFATADTTPLHYLDSASTCPSSGTLVVNNATIVYGSPITVTVGSDVKTYTDCSLMDSGGMCGN